MKLQKVNNFLMASVEQLRQSKKFQRFISATLALGKTGEALENYTQGILQKVYTQIQQKLIGQGLPICTKACSRQKGDDFSR